MSGGFQNYNQDFFVYTVSFGNVASLATVPVSITIQADSDFQWQMSTWWAIESGATEPASSGILLPLTITIQDGGSGRQLLSASTPVGTIAGDGKQPFILLQPRIFASKSTVNFVITSIDGSNAWNNVYFMMIGRKLFGMG